MKSKIQLGNYLTNCNKIKATARLKEIVDTINIKYISKLYLKLWSIMLSIMFIEKTNGVLGLLYNVCKLSNLKTLWNSKQRL